MRLLLDANISTRLVAPLQEMGHDVVSQLQENPNAADVDILKRAHMEQRIVITYDKDFGELVFKHDAGHFGVILLRTRNESYSTQLATLQEFLNHHTEDEIQEHFWVLTESVSRKARIF